LRNLLNISSRARRSSLHSVTIWSQMYRPAHSSVGDLATMCLMKSKVVVVTALIAGMMACAPRMAAQTGSLQFIARARPSDGLEEPVRGFPFYLLSKSFEEIGKEADTAEPKPDMDAFITKLEVSPELKAWMKKNQSVTLSGEDFIRKLHPDDVLGVPEFLKAYMDRNSGDRSTNFPQSKAKASDKVKDPAKYQKLSDEYTETIRRFIQANPQTVDGIDLNLTEIDPGPKWNDLLGKRVPEVHRRTIDLAQSKYLVAQTETDVQGQGFLRGIPPGTYWISTLDVSADVGDARLRWDVPATIRAGETANVALTNVNSVHPQESSP
jgi:hypothetical protein